MELATIAECVGYFRPLGFFTDLEALPAATAAVELATRGDAWIGSLSMVEVADDEPRCFRDLHVLACDRSRVWRLESWERLFCTSAKREGFAFCNDYGEVVGQLARISAHRFSLTARNVREGQLTLVIDGSERRLRFKTDMKAFCPDFLTQVNAGIRFSGEQFVFVTSRFCQGFILLLPPGQREQLRRERGWTPEAL